MKEILHRQNSLAISLTSFSLLSSVSTGNFQRALVDESEMIGNQMGTHNSSEMFSVQESPCAPAPQG
jgi:hypothetical protein